MKYLKYFNSLHESLDENQILLKDIFSDLSDEGYQLEYLKGYDDKGKYEYRVIIEPKKEKILIDDLVITTLKKSVSMMNDNGFRYQANYKNWYESQGRFSSPVEFNIYLDDRNLQCDGMKMSEIWPTPYRINIDFFQ